MLKELIVFANLILLSYACLITNCPRGGKRGDIAPLETIARECPSCGPNHLGQCFGPHICCGPSIGCFIGTPETYRCRKESLYTRPCIAGYAMCRGKTARCATNGICCSQESCHMDTSCRISNIVDNNRKIDTDLNMIIPGNEVSSEILQ
ncbi:oxytocin-neurophysin 1-like [Linepithema humile]|uniref:oxytocin-neurophysin 1-like n=1 Tax=Linepithema humile TaxID=83485 RepID=UPI0006238B9B|nr:PREDICTED: neurophysin 1-like [Linepithema humile]